MSVVKIIGASIRPQNAAVAPAHCGILADVARSAGDPENRRSGLCRVYDIARASPQVRGTHHRDRFAHPGCFRLHLPDHRPTGTVAYNSD